MTCSFPACGRSARKAGLCWGHDSQKRSGRSLRPIGRGGPDPTPVAERFWRHVDKSGDCWLWIGGRDRGGYGTFQDRRRTFGTHRMAWMLTHGEIPPRMEVCHRCDVRNCVNPAHLFVATHAANMADCKAKGRIDDRRGERAHCRRKLTESDVREILRARAAGEYGTVIARRFGITSTQVYFIAKGTSWGHVTNPGGG